MAESTAEFDTKPRIITSFEEIVSSPDVPSKLITEKLSKIAGAVGVDDMRSAVETMLGSSQYIELREVGTERGQSSCVPEINLEVSLANVREVNKLLVSGMVLSWALFNNESFRVHWQSRCEPEGIFGATWEHGYFVFRRVAMPHAAYLGIMDTYGTHLKKVQDWYKAQTSSIMFSTRRVE